MMGLIVFGSFLQILALASAESNLHILQDLMSYEFLPTCNIITCNENETINLIKMLSTRLQKFVTVHSADKALMPYVHHPQNFVLDLQCHEATNILRQAESLKLFQKPFQWVLLGDGLTGNLPYETGTNVSESGEAWYWPFLESLSILADSDVKVVEKDSDEKITVTGAYKLGNTLLKETLAEWTSKESFAFLNRNPLLRRRWDLRGLHIPSATVVTHPDTLQHLEDLVDTQIDTTTKVTYNMVNVLGDILRARLSYKIEKEWGVLINGTWTGMVGDLERKEIEIGGAPLFFQKRRLHIVEYFSTVTTSRSKFLFLAPPLSYSSNIFALPFDTIVWACCFSMVAISCGFLYAALSHEKAQTNGTKVSFSEIVVFNVGAICQQGTVAETSNPPGRIFTLFLYLSYMFLYISYSACIVAILQSSDTSIQTLSDFLKSPMKAGAEDMVYVRDYFKIVDGEVHKAIYRKKIAPKGEAPHFLSVKDGIKEVRKGFYGYHVEVSLGYKEIQKTFTEEEKCGLQELKESYFQFPEPFVVMRKGTPFAEHFKVGMFMSVERGFKSRFVRRYYTKKPICTSKAARFVSVGLVDCYWAFMLFTVGVITAVMIMLFEIAYSKYKKDHDRLRSFSGKDITPGERYWRCPQNSSEHSINGIRRWRI